MKTKWFAKTVSIILVFCILITMLPLSVFAKEKTVESELKTDYSIDTSNALGSAISEMSGGPEVGQNKDGYSVSWIEVEGNVATVDFHCDEPCNLVVAIYTENNQMIASGNVFVDPEMNDAEVWIEIEEMPEFFIAKAFLLDSDMGALCAEYVCEDYTEAYQAFLKLTVDDFDEDSVISFGEEKDTNFFVANENAQIAFPSADTNILIDINEEKCSYTFENPDNIIRGLLAGDVFFYNTGDENFILVKVKSLKMKDNCAVVYADSDASFEDLFGIIKIDIENSGGEATMDTSTMDPGLIYLGEETVIQGEPSISTFAARKDIYKDGSFTKKFNYQFGPKYENGGLGFSVRGNIGFTASGTFRCRYSATKYLEIPKDIKDVYVSVTARLDYGLNISASYEKTDTLPLGAIEISFYKIIGLSGNASLVFIVSGHMGINGYVSHTFGFNRYNEKTERVDSWERNITPSVEADITIRIGIDFSVTVKVLEFFFTATLGAQAGVEFGIVGKNYAEIFNDGDAVFHNCDFCFQGDLNLYINCYYEGKLFGIKIFGDKFVEEKFSLLKFYFSESSDRGNEFAYGDCPHKLFRTDFSVRTISEEPLKDVYVGSGEYYAVTDLLGNGYCYFPPGTYTISAECEGFDDFEKQITVKNPSSHAIRMKSNRVRNIEVTKKPVEKKYYTEDRFDSTGMELLITYLDGRKETVTKGFTCSPSVFTVSGKQPVTISYGNGTCEYYVDVTKLTVTDVKLISVPEYRAGYSVASSDLNVVLKLNNGKTVELSGNNKSLTFTPDILTESGNQTISAEYNGKPFEFDVYVIPVTSITFETVPKYYAGDALNKKSLIIGLVYEDGFTGLLQGNNANLKFFPNKFETHGVQNVTVSYFDKSASTSIDVIPVVLERIAISNLPQQTYYLIGETFDPTGITIEELYNNGNVVQVTNGYTCETDSFNETGLHTVTVNHKGLKTAFDVLVEEKPTYSSGKCGINMYWYFLPEISKLYIVGYGEMYFNLRENYPWYFCREDITSLEIGLGVTVIQMNAFYNFEKLTNVELSESVTEIGHAFINCTSLETMEIPESVTNIGHAFVNCTSLESIEIPASVTYTSYAFQDCINLTNVTFAENSQLTRLGYGTFKNCTGLVSVGTLNGQSSSASIVIPPSVIVIESEVFNGCTEIENAYIPDNVKNLGDDVFSGCTSLKEVVLSDNLVSLGWSAFAGCISLESIDIPSGVTSIRPGAFGGCTSLSSVNFGKNSKLTQIGTAAFSDCTSLTSIEIPATVTALENVRLEQGKPFFINSGAFSGCINLTTVTFAPGSQLAYIGTRSFFDCTSLTEIVIPETVNRIYNSAFENCSELNSVIFEGESSLENIDAWAFSNCKKLKQIEIPANVSTIQWGVFRDCENLEEIVFEENSRLESIDRWYLDSTKIKNIKIPANVSSMEPEAFADCSALISLTFEEGCQLSAISEGAFVNCSNLKSIKIPAKVKTVGSSAFQGCENLEVIEFEKNSQLETIVSSWGLQSTKISEIEIPSSVKTIDHFCFTSCLNLKTVTFEENSKLSFIGVRAFSECENLESIVIPASVTHIDANAFMRCRSLSDFTFEGNSNLEILGSGAFYHCDKLESIVIPAGVSGDGYSSFGLRGTFVGCTSLKNVVFEEGCPFIYEIGPSTFMDCVSLESIEIPESVISIGSSAFENCTSLKSINIPDCGKAISSVSLIGNKAFYNCTSLVSVTFEGNCIFTSIGENAFYNCSSLKGFEIPASITSIGTGAFEGCSDLSNVTFGEGLTSIGDSSFYNCSSLKGVDIPASVTSIGTNAFGGCSELSDVSFEEGLVSIGDRAFYDCTNLANIVIPASVTMIGNLSFYQCSSLKTVEFEENSFLKSIGNYGFAYCTALEAIDVPDRATLGYRTFYGCTSLKKAEISGDIEDIGDEAFGGCTDIEIDFGGTEDEWKKLTGEDEVNGNVNFNDPENKYSVLTASESGAIPGNRYTLLVFDYDGGDYDLANLAFIETTIAETTEITFTYIPKVSSGLKTIIVGDFEEGSGGEVNPAPEEPKINKGVRAESVYLSETVLSLNAGQSPVKIEATVLPADASIKSVYWTSSDSLVASVNSLGYVSPIGEGTAVITATTRDGEYFADCVVNVSQPDYNIEWIIDEENSVIQSVGYGEKITKPIYPEKIGMTFLGWSPLVMIRMPAYDLRYTAVWSGNKYDAVFNANGGYWSDGSFSKIVKTAFNGKIVAPVSPQREGYVFGGWLFDGEEVINLGVLDDINGKKFTASWIPADDTVYTIETYRMNTQGEYELESSVKRTETTGETVTCCPQDEVGFTLNSENSILSGTVTADSSLVLKVYFDRNIYTLTTTVDETVNSTDYYYESAISVEEPTKVGYVFDKWSKTIPATMPANDIAFEALWRPETYFAVFDANGGKWDDGRTVKSVSAVYDSDIKTPEIPEKAGNIFAGWMLDGKNYGSDAGTMNRTENIRFNASWIAEGETVYTIKTYTMNTSGEYECSTEVIYAEVGETKALTPVIEKGFDLNEEKSVLSGTVASDNSLVLKVYIDRNVYSLSTVVDGAVSSRNYYFGEKISKPSVPYKNGYTFLYWSVGIPATMPAENITTTAIYDINTYTVTWNVDGKITCFIYDYDEYVEIPDSPKKEGFAFKGWGADVPVTMPANNLDFVALWDINTYTVMWNDGSEKTTVKYDYGEPVEIPDDPKKEGCTFKGWNADIPATMPANNLEFVAQWDVITYTVTWNIDGKIITDEYAYGDKIEKPVAPQKKGYTFTGWGAAVPETMPSGNLEFNAEWGVNEYTVLWIMDRIVYIRKVPYGSAVIAPQALEMTGYTFTGWGGKIPETMPSYGLHFYANYEPNIYNASFDPDGGVWSDGTSVTKSISVRYGKAVPEQENPEKQGYIFAGWSLNGTDVTALGKMNNINGKSFVAVWIPDDETIYTVNTYRMNTFGEYELEFSEKCAGAANETVEYDYVAETGFILNEELSVLSGMVTSDKHLVLSVYLDRNNYSLTTVVDGVSTETLYYYEAMLADLVSPEKDGYTFVGWDNAVPSSMPAENIVITALWDINTYTVTWSVDGEETTSMYNYGDFIEKPEDPKKTGYSFNGWNGNIPETMPSNDLVFVANWSVDFYEATFDADGGKWSDSSIVKKVLIEYGSEISIPEVPVKQGYVFSGWGYNGENLGTDLGVMDTVKGKKFSAVWLAATDTPYIIETYIMNTESDYDKSAQELKGTTGKIATIEPLVSEGFILNIEKSVLSDIIAADGSMILKVYIDRNKYTFTTVADGVSSNTEYLYGATLTEPSVPVKSGYKFIRWNNDIPETMPAYDLTLVAVFEKSYICPDCGNEILGEDAINEHIESEARMKATVKIKNNTGSITIKYGETLCLTATTNMPADIKIYWYVNGVKMGEGEIFNINFENGTKTIEVKLVDANGNVLKNANGNEIKDTENVTVKGGFFQKIISFFKNLFRMNRTVVQAIFKGTL